jgi:hypothetical protein
MLAMPRKYIAVMQELVAFTLSSWQEWNVNLLADLACQHGVNLRVARDSAPAAIVRIEHAGMPATFLEETAVLLQVLNQLATLHDSTFIGTRTLTGIVSMKIALRSLAFGLGVGNGSPISMCACANMRKASRTMRRAERSVLPWLFAPGKSRTMATIQPSSPS